MRPLSARQKIFLYSNFVYGKLHVLTKTGIALPGQPGYCII